MNDILTYDRIVLQILQCHLYLELRIMLVVHIFSPT